MVQYRIMKKFKVSVTLHVASSLTVSLDYRRYILFLAESCTYTFRVLEELLNAIRNARVLFIAKRQVKRGWTVSISDSTTIVVLAMRLLYFEAYLFRAERLGSEIIAARLEASFNETCVELEKVLHLLLLDDAGHGLLLRRREVRDWTETKPDAETKGQRRIICDWVAASVDSRSMVVSQSKQPSCYAEECVPVRASCRQREERQCQFLGHS